MRHYSSPDIFSDPAHSERYSFKRAECSLVGRFEAIEAVQQLADRRRADKRTGVGVVAERRLRSRDSERRESELAEFQLFASGSAFLVPFIHVGDLSYACSAQMPASTAHESTLRTLRDSGRY